MMNANDAYKPKTEKSVMTALTAAVTGTRWCNYHQGDAVAADGAMVVRGKVTVWMCGGCRKKRKLI